MRRKQESDVEVENYPPELRERGQQGGSWLDQSILRFSSRLCRRIGRSLALPRQGHPHINGARK